MTTATAPSPRTKLTVAGVRNGVEGATRLKTYPSAAESKGLHWSGARIPLSE